MSGRDLVRDLRSIETPPPKQFARGGIVDVLIGAVAVLTILTGLPAYSILLLGAVTGAATGLATGAIDVDILRGVTLRLQNLLENDLLQALPLFMLMGALLRRLPVTSALFRSGTKLFGGGKSAPVLSGFLLGALLGPMNGSVGASVLGLSRVVAPRLEAHGVPEPTRAALVAVASTLGVVIPPSLVLILLGDAMMRAHTEAASKTAANVRIINTQDVFRGSLTPALIFFVLCLVLAWWNARREPARQAQALPARLHWHEWAAALITVTFIVVLLAGVTIGYFYAVEAAAMGAFALFVFGVASGALKPAAISGMLRDAMAVSGALLALLAAATTFTLVADRFGTDRLLDLYDAFNDPKLTEPAGAELTAAAVERTLGVGFLDLERDLRRWIVTRAVVDPFAP